MTQGAKDTQNITLERAEISFKSLTDKKNSKSENKKSEISDFSSYHFNQNSLSDFKTAENNLLLFRHLKGQENAINRPKKKASTRCNHIVKVGMLLDDCFCIV